MFFRKEKTQKILLLRQFFLLFFAVKADQFPVYINPIEKSITAIDFFAAIAARSDEFTHPVNLQHKHTLLLSGI